MFGRIYLVKIEHSLGYGEFETTYKEISWDEYHDLYRTEVDGTPLDHITRLTMWKRQQNGDLKLDRTVQVWHHLPDHRKTEFSISERVIC